MRPGLGASSLLVIVLVGTVVLATEVDQVSIYLQVNACVQSCVYAISSSLAKPNLSPDDSAPSCVCNRLSGVAGSAHNCASTFCQHSLTSPNVAVLVYMILIEYCQEYGTTHSLPVYAFRLTTNTHVHTFPVSPLLPPMDLPTKAKPSPIIELQGSRRHKNLNILIFIISGCEALCMFVGLLFIAARVKKVSVGTQRRSWPPALTKAFQNISSTEDGSTYDSEKCQVTRNVQRRAKKLSSGFQRHAYLWSHSKPELQQLGFVRFDSGCESSNWVARRIVLDCEAEIKILPTPVLFPTADNGKLWAKEQVWLDFRSARGGNEKPYTHSALFYILPDDSPGEVIIGEEYMVSGGLSKGVVFGIFKPSSTSAEKKADDENDADNKAIAEDYASARAAVKAKASKRKECRCKKTPEGKDEHGRCKSCKVQQKCST